MTEATPRWLKLASARTVKDKNGGEGARGKGTEQRETVRAEGGLYAAWRDRIPGAEPDADSITRLDASLL